MVGVRGGGNCGIRSGRVSDVSSGAHGRIGVPRQEIQAWQAVEVLKVVPALGDRNSNRIDGNPPAYADLDVLRGGRGGKLSARAISGNRYGVPGGEVFRHRIHCRALRPAFPAGTAASTRSLGMATVLRCVDLRPNRGWRRCEPETRNCHLGLRCKPLYNRQRSGALEAIGRKMGANR